MEFAAGVAVTRDITLVRPLSEGAMGRVWVARHAKLGRDVAVKFMADKLVKDRAMLARFTREAESAAQIKSPHVVSILEHGTTDGGTPYIAMELMVGETLGQRLERDTRLPLELASAILRQVGSALDAAHARGIVHRDIKPDNLFLVATGAGFTVKVLDFGMAKRVRQRSQSIVTATGVAVGTPDYMSPEQVLGAKDVDFRSDLWGLAVVAYNMITGETAFEASTPHALFFTICKGSFTPLARHGVSNELEPWFKRAFQPSKEKRFGSAREMVLRFEACAQRAALEEDEPTEAIRPTEKLRVLERFGTPQGPESQTNPRYQKPTQGADPLEDSVDHLASTLDFRASDIVDEDSDEDGVPTQMVDKDEAARAIRDALAVLGNPMGETASSGPDSQTTVRTLSDDDVSGYDKTVNSRRNPFDDFADPLDMPPESESVPGVSKPRLPLESDAPVDYPDMGDADESGPRPALASHSPDSSGARISVSSRRAEELARDAEAKPAAAVQSPVLATAKKSRGDRSPLVTFGGLAAVAAVALFVVLSTRSPNPPAEASHASQVEPAPPEKAKPAAQPAPTVDAAPAPSATVAPPMGTVSITCQPQCINVRLGDEMLGRTPLLNKELPIGKHQISLIRQGMSTSVVEIEIEEGQHVTRSFNLTAPEPAPAAPTPPAEPQVVDDPYE